MMRDLTRVVLAAKERAAAWSRERCHAALAEIASAIPASEVECDWHAGEGWGRVTSDLHITHRQEFRGRVSYDRGTMCAIVKSDIPLMFVCEPVPAAMDGEFREQGIVVLRTDWEEEQFSFDPRAATEVPPRWVFPDEVFRDPDEYPPAKTVIVTMADFWWATV
jgi:hypothetical protein